MQDKKLNQTLAVAGLMHACWLVRQTARGHRVEEHQLAMALAPVFQLEPPSVAAVYGDNESQHAMLSVLKSQLGGHTDGRDLEITRYAATLLHLERKASRDKALMDRLRSGIEQAQTQLEHFEITHENVIGRLADIYRDTVSTLRPQGEASLLTDARNANRVRALLLAGVRSAVLWRQCGGSRLQLILGRQRLLRATHELERERDGSG
jgi:high frequency lysogenization protein